MKEIEIPELMEKIRTVVRANDTGEPVNMDDLRDLLLDYDRTQAEINARSPSEVWMRKWAVRHVAYDYYGDAGGMRSEDDAYAFALRIGEDNSVGPYDDARDYIDDEWWDHWENITGRTGERGSYFRCAC